MLAEADAPLAAFMDPPLPADQATRWYIISPSNKVYSFWGIFVSFIAVYITCAYPLNMGFFDNPATTFSLVNYLANLAMFIDIFVTFFVSYVDEPGCTIIDDPLRIARRYLTSWLVFDFISTMPLLYAFRERKSLGLVGLLVMIQPKHARKVNVQFSRLEGNLKLNYSIVKFFKLICITLLYIHCCGCYYHALANHHPLDQSKEWTSLLAQCMSSIWSGYVASLYWALTTLSTVGYGDLHPICKKEMAFSIGYMIANLVMSAYISGHIMLVIASEISNTKKCRDAIEAASSFVKRYHLPLNLQNQMISLLSEKLARHSEGLLQQETINSSPTFIRSELAHTLVRSIQDKDLYLFRDVSPELLLQLVYKMGAEDFPPNINIVVQNRRPGNIYILFTGAVDIVNSRGGVEETVQKLRGAQMIGEVAALCNRAHFYTVRTTEKCYVLGLTRKAFLDIVRADTKDAASILINLVQHLDHNVLMRPFQLEIGGMIARGKVDMPLNLRFATTRENAVLLEKLLSRGVDADECDVFGRTALHIAASKGDFRCVKCLIDFKADPNARDSEGRVPLLEAMLFGMDCLAIEELVTAGARLENCDPEILSRKSDELKDPVFTAAVTKHGGRLLSRGTSTIQINDD